MPRSAIDSSDDNVIDIFTRKPLSELTNNRLVRISAELDGLEMLYSNQENPDKLFSIKILAWGLRLSGEVVALVPWLSKLMPCDEIRDPLNGQWQGYYDQGIDELFFSAPLHKVMELETAAEYYDYQCDFETEVIQEIPDSIGTHSVLSENGFQSICLKEVVSWRLLNNGTVEAMLIDEKKMDATPVLPGDDCLYPAEQNPDFKYFFQHNIANKIKCQDPEALAAILLLQES